MGTICVHQAFTGATYERPGMTSWSNGWHVTAHSRYGLKMQDLWWTDKALRLGDPVPLLAAKDVHGLGWCEAAIWSDDEPERIARRVDKRRGFTRAHVLIWPRKQDADRYRDRVPHVDPATVGDGAMTGPLNAIFVQEERP